MITYSTTAIGNLTKDPEPRNANGKEFVVFTIAVNVTKDDTRFVECIVWADKLRSIITQYAKKGTKMIVRGTPGAHAYIRKTDGQPAAVEKLNVYEIHMIGSGAQQQQEEQPAQSNAAFDDIDTAKMPF